MKKILAVTLSVLCLLSGCTAPKQKEQNSAPDMPSEQAEASASSSADTRTDAEILRDEWNAKDAQAYEILLSVYDDALKVMLWYYSPPDDQSLKVDMNTVLAENSFYRKVENFSSTAEMKAETEKYFTADFCEMFFYNHAFLDSSGNNSPMYMDAGGALYRNIDRGGLIWPYQLTEEYYVTYNSDDMLVFFMDVMAMDQAEQTYFVLKKDDGRWKINQWYDFSPYQEYEEKVEPAVSAWFCTEDWNDPNDLSADRLLTFYKNQYLKDAGGNYNDLTPYTAPVDEITSRLSVHFTGLKKESLLKITEEDRSSFEYDAAKDSIAFYITFDSANFIISSAREAENSVFLDVLIIGKSAYASYWGTLEIQKNADNLRYLSNKHTPLIYREFY